MRPLSLKYPEQKWTGSIVQALRTSERFPAFKSQIHQKKPNQNKQKRLLFKVGDPFCPMAQRA
jgi:hypothetical protein